MPTDVLRSPVPRRPIWYDYTNAKYRADSFFESGNSNPLTTLFNFTSIWVNESLSMITYADPRSLQPESCIILNLGIGMMRPDWMIAPVSSCMGDIWVTAKSAGFDEDYHRAVWTRINALPGDEGNFDWRVGALRAKSGHEARRTPRLPLAREDERKDATRRAYL